MVKPQSTLPIVLGLAAGCFASLLLFYGATGIVWVARFWRRTDGQDVVAVALCTLTGAFCAVVSARWIRSGLRARR